MSTERGRRYTTIEYYELPHYADPAYDAPPHFAPPHFAAAHTYRRPRPKPRPVSHSRRPSRRKPSPIARLIVFSFIIPLLVGCPTNRPAFRSHTINLYAEHHATSQTRDYMQTWNDTLDQRATYHFALGGDVEEAIDKALAESDDLRATLTDHIQQDRMGDAPTQALLVSVEHHSRERLRSVLASVAGAEE
ncbi:MAG: hypothetical protein ACYTGQ_05425 [Planctomycetota bacterium]|jgi:hypothetical protein